jgi:CheY-like chemotaxis protein
VGAVLRECSRGRSSLALAAKPLEKGSPDLFCGGLAVVFPTENNQHLSHLRGRQQVLLCICNCEEILAVRKLLLEAFGYEVLTADGSESIDSLPDQPVDIVIMDYRAAGTNGELLVIKTKIIQPLTPILLLVDDPATVPESVAKLARGVIRRDYSPVMLLEEIARIIHMDRGYSANNLVARRTA